MFRSPCWLALAVLLACGPAANPAHASIVDRGNIFSDATVTQVNQDIAELRQRYGRDVVVETFAEIPSERAKDYLRKPTRKEKGLFFRDWARARARDLGVQGVYILICKEPSAGRAEIGDKAAAAFSADDRLELDQILRHNLRDHHPDQALRGSVEHIADVLRDYHNRTSSGGRQGNLVGLVLLGLAVVLTIWVVSAVIRAFTTRTGSGGEGGGFVPSLLGGLFGATAGTWVYQALTSAGPSSAAGVGPEDGNDPGPGHDTDPTGVGREADRGRGGGEFGDSDYDRESGAGGNF